MWNQPSDALLNRLSRFCSPEHMPLNDRIVYLHFFFGSQKEKAGELFLLWLDGFIHF
jgi:hypothetical protein